MARPYRWIFASVPWRRCRKGDSRGGRRRPVLASRQHGDQLGSAVPGNGQRGAWPDRRPQTEERSPASTMSGWCSGSGSGEFTLRGLVAELAERGLKVDYRSVWKFVHAEKLSFKKKTLIAGEQDRPDVARRRAQWAEHQGRIDPDRLVFIDETWTKTNMAPLQGWAPRGGRLRPRFRTATGRR